MPSRDLSRTVCVVFDVLRATSTLLEALANGADSILPVPDIASSLLQKSRDPAVLLAGERDGLKITAAVSGGAEFDLGNSPREFTRERVAGRRIVMTTTNGTRALDSCSGAASVLAASFSNLAATARWLERRDVTQVCLIGAGTRDHSAWEDALGIGALVDLVWERTRDGWVDDAARVVREVYLTRRSDLAAALGEGRNGRRLLSLPELAADVALCAQSDRFDFVAVRGAEGVLRREPASD